MAICLVFEATVSPEKKKKNCQKKKICSILFISILMYDYSNYSFQYNKRKLQHKCQISFLHKGKESGQCSIWIKIFLSNFSFLTFLEIFQVLLNLILILFQPNALRPSYNAYLVSKMEWMQLRRHLGLSFIILRIKISEKDIWQSGQILLQE